MNGAGPIRIDRLAIGEDRAAWADAISGFEMRTARRLKHEGGDEVLSAFMLGRRVIIKMIAQPDRLRLRLGRTRADRHWRSATWLEQRGIRTARCLVLARETRADGGWRQWLVMEHLEGSTLLEWLSAPNQAVSRQHLLARNVGQVLRLVEQGGCYNRDSKPSNLIVLEAPGGPEAAVIDCVGVRRLPPAWARRRALARMHASVVLEAIGCGIVPRRSLLMRGLLASIPPTIAGGREERNRRWRTAARLIQRHGDARPRVNPLGPGPLEG